MTLPRTLKLEVKAPRSGECQLSSRDIAGITPDGFLVALVSDRSHPGLAWVVVPVSHLSAGSATAKELVDSQVMGELSELLNLGWSNWILDREAWGMLLRDGVSGVRSRIAWCREHHPPRQNSARGRLREAKLADALSAFRAAIDSAVAGRTGAQQEGNIHQVLLEDILQVGGYVIVENPIGVPDIQAQLRDRTHSQS